MSKYLLNLPDERYDALRELKEQTQMPVAALLRLMVLHCTQQHVFNEMLPSMSGQVQLASNKG